MAVAQKQRVIGLTPKQKMFVKKRVEMPTASTSAVMRAAGYSEASLATEDIRKYLKTKKVQDAIANEMEVKLKAEKDYKDYKKEGKQYLNKRFLEHARDAQILPNQTHALELVGKLDGHFVEKIEVDIGENTRRLFTNNFLKGEVIEHTRLLGTPENSET